MTGRLTNRYVALWSCVAASAMFVLFQGGKVAFMIFTMVCILTVYLLLGRWSGVVRAEGERRLAASVLGSELQAGTSLSVHIRIRIPGYWPIPYVIVSDRLERKNGGSQTFETSFIPDWKRRGEIEYRTPPLRRGVYQFKQTVCMTEDIFGLFRHRGEMELPNAFRVLPKTANIREWQHFNLLSRGIYYHSADARALRETTQINGVRDYVYGDRISRIHWNASARTGKWKSKEFERESLPKMIVVLDACKSAYRSSDRFELAVSAAASFLQFGERNKLAQGLIVTGQQPVVYRPIRDMKHNLTMMNQLISVEADGDKPLSAVLPELGKQIDRRCFIVLVTPQSPGAIRPIAKWTAYSQHMSSHIWLDGGQLESDDVAGTAIKTYRLSALEQLPHVLEGSS